jgi:hypothetical protein
LPAWQNAAETAVMDAVAYLRRLLGVVLAIAAAVGRL